MPKRLPFPSAESDLNVYFQAVVLHANENATRLHINPDTLTILNSHLHHWNNYYPKSQNNDLRTKSITQNKNIYRENLIVSLREMYRNIPFNAYTTEDRNVFNLPERKETRSAPPVPDSTPVLSIDMRHRLQHSVKFYNNGGSKSKPYLCRGCQIWYKIGDAPTHISELQYLATAPKSPYIHHFNGDVAGKQIHYWARWENTAGKTGSWSNEVAATIAG
jgi:hypothetical protein